jgi:hypothetical protein
MKQFEGLTGTQPMGRMMGLWFLNPNFDRMLRSTGKFRFRRIEEIEVITGK